MNGNENKADYFALDIDYLLNVCNDMGFSTGAVKERRETGYKYIRSGREKDVDPGVKRLISAVFVGDGEWNQPLEEWLPFPFNDTLFLLDSTVHKKWMDTAKAFGDVSLVNVPDYSVPSEFEIRGEKPVSLVGGLDQMMLACAILDLEWFAYVAKQSSAELDIELVEKTRREALNYYTGVDQDLSDRSALFLYSTFNSALKWIEDTEEEYGFNSRLLDIIISRGKREIEKFEELSS